MGRAKEEGILAEEHLQSLLGNRQMIIERIYEAQFRPKHLRRLPVHISDEEKAKLEELYNEGWWDPHMDTQPAHLERHCRGTGHRFYLRRKLLERRTN